MDTQPSRLSLFNEMFLLILQQLVEQIPHRHDFDPTILAARMSVDVTPERQKLGSGYGQRQRDDKTGFAPLRNGENFYDLYDATMDFMEREGFIVRRGRAPQVMWAPGLECGITAKGIAAINLPMPGQQQSVGDQIGDLSRSVATEGRQAAISSIVGVIIGAAARGFTGQGSG